MFCFSDSATVSIRTALYIDVFVYFLYVAAPERAFVRAFTRMVLFGNVCLIFLLSFASFTGTDFGWSYEAVGLLLAAMYALMKVVDFLGYKSLLGGVGTGVLLITAQLTNTYVPTILHSKFGISMEAAATVSLLIPVVALALLQAAIYSALTTRVLVCMSLSVLTTLAFATLRILRSDEIYLAGAVCCDLEGECPLWLTQKEIYVLIMLFGILLVRVAYVKVYNFIRVYFCCGCCCCCCRKQTVDEVEYEELHQEYEQEQEQTDEASNDSEESEQMKVTQREAADDTEGVSAEHFSSPEPLPAASRIFTRRSKPLASSVTKKLTQPPR